MIHPKMTDKAYRLIDALAQSDLAWMRHSPRHFKMRKELQKETDAMRFGSIFHLALLEPAEFKAKYLCEPETITLDGKTVELNKRVSKHRDWLAAWKIDNAEKVIVSEKELEALTRMLNSVMDDPDLCELISTGEAETVATWNYKGRKCKGKADLFNTKTSHGKVVIDFKKTQDASPSGFSRSIFNFAYDLQSAYYSQGFEADKFFFVAVEEKTGAIGKYDAYHYIERGRKLMDKLMDRLAECERTNEWPWYTKNFDLILPPTWVAALDDEKQE